VTQDVADAPDRVPLDLRVIRRQFRRQCLGGFRDGHAAALTRQLQDFDGQLR